MSQAPEEWRQYGLIANGSSREILLDSDQVNGTSEAGKTPPDS